MALIGTISGSNGTTTSAVTGSIIIAADPGAITPTKPPGVVLFVSGTQTSIGAEQPSIIFKGDTFVSGAFGTDSYITMGATVERFTHYQSTGSTIAFDMTTGSIFYVNNPTGDITANFTKVPTTNNRIVTPTVILSQSATARTITAVQVEGTLQTPINWANGVTPIANVNKQDVFGFSLIRSGSAWKVLGQMSTYG